MAFSRYRDALVQWDASERPLVYQPLVPRIFTACYQVFLLPTRDFGELLFFCLGRLCRLIAVGHAVRHTKRKN